MQQEVAAVGIEAGPLSPEGVASGGGDRRRPPGRLGQRCDELEGLHARAGHATTEGAGEAPAAFVVAGDAHRLGRRLPASGGAGPQAAGPRLDNVRSRSRVFLAGLGLGRFRVAVR